MGRAEVPRLVFAQAGVEYEDKRIESEEWPEMKKSKDYTFFISEIVRFKRLRRFQ